MGPASTIDVKTLPVHTMRTTFALPAGASNGPQRGEHREQNILTRLSQR